MDECIRTCPHCGAAFSANDLVYSEEIRPIGVCLDPETRSFNYFYFNHEVPGCGTTFIIHVEALLEFVREEIPPGRLTDGTHCPGHCLDLNDSAVCNAACYYAPFRRLLQYMLEIRGIKITPSHYR